MNLGVWQFEPTQVVPVLAAGGVYALGVRRLTARGRSVPRSRIWAFGCGLAIALLALVSPIDYLGENRMLWVHMVQHLLLGDIAPLLIVLGLSGPILRPVLAVRAVQRLRFLAHPAVALPLWTIDLFGWHLRVAYEAALRHPGVHALEHLCFFACGALMWTAVIEPLPGPVWFGNGAKAVYTLIVRVAGGVLGTLFIWSGHAFYPYYARFEALSHISPLTDQRLAGAIMFTEGSVVTLVAFGWLFLRFAREAEMRQRLVERGELPEALAARAARYGRSSRLRGLD
jgi:cytochrome c oxidase assembly factor CtaG